MGMIGVKMAMFRIYGRFGKGNHQQLPIGSMYAIYSNIYHQYTPNVSIYTIHGSYGLYKDLTITKTEKKSGWTGCVGKMLEKTMDLPAKKLQVNPLQFYDLQLVVRPKSPSNLIETSRISGHFWWPWRYGALSRKVREPNREPGTEPREPETAQQPAVGKPNRTEPL